MYARFRIKIIFISWDTQPKFIRHSELNSMHWSLIRVHNCNQFSTLVTTAHQRASPTLSLEPWSDGKGPHRWQFPAKATFVIFEGILKHVKDWHIWLQDSSYIVYKTHQNIYYYIFCNANNWIWDEFITAKVNSGVGDVCVVTYLQLIIFWVGNKEKNYFCCSVKIGT